MNCSLFKSRVFGYLSYLDIEVSDEVDSVIAVSLDKLTNLDCFAYRYTEYTELLPFMNKEPYTSFLSGANGYYLVATTLGEEVDSIKNSLDDKSRLIFDACANAYLEIKNEELKARLGNDLSYMFSPGYQGSDVKELRFILDELKSDEIGIKMIESGMMTPIKSMAGIYAKGVSPQKKCGSCIMLKNCVYRKAGKLCFHP